MWHSRVAGTKLQRTEDAIECCARSSGGLVLGEGSVCRRQRRIDEAIWEKRGTRLLLAPLAGFTGLCGALALIWKPT